MLAVVKSRPEVGIEIMEMPEPEIRKGHVMIEVKACGICGSDLHFYDWAPLARWITLPRILGHEVAGTICEVGEEVEGFAPGDRIVADTWGGCGSCYFCRLGRFNHCMHQTRLGQHVDGGMAKYVIVPSNSLFKVPEGVDLLEASVIEPLGVVLRAFERCDMKPGDDIVIMGPGPIGLLGVMLAKHSGAATVIASGLKDDKERLGYATKFGAVTVTVGEENLKDKVLELTNGKGADIVMDVSGGQASLADAASIVKRGGQIGVIGLSPEGMFNPYVIVDKELTIHGSFRRQPSTWFRAIKLVASKVIDTRPIITHVLPLQRAEEGFRTLLRKEGLKVVLVP
ncbi:MAG: Sorbitol dehydrogenase [Syntrophorhabdus sp. PtaU1.Bin058]|nr:MAG: Sorbitol dehydrogenase [Syntrophorhabdus sp. PtaU1.Bin058]